MAGNCPIFAEHMPCGSWCAWYSAAGTYECKVLNALVAAINDGKIMIDVDKTIAERMQALGRPVELDVSQRNL